MSRYNENKEERIERAVNNDLNTLRYFLLNDVTFRNNMKNEIIEQIRNLKRQSDEYRANKEFDKADATDLKAVNVLEVYIEAYGDQMDIDYLRKKLPYLKKYFDDYESKHPRTK